MNNLQPISANVNKDEDYQMTLARIDDINWLIAKIKAKVGIMEVLTKENDATSKLLRKLDEQLQVIFRELI